MHMSALTRVIAGLVGSLALLPPAFGQVASSSIHGSWSVECSGDGGKCAATQKVTTDPEGVKVVLGVMVEPAKGKGAPQLTFRMSNRAYVPAGAGLKIDDHEPLRAPISGCDAEVCEVRAWLTPELSRQMRGGKLLIFAYFLDSQRQMSLPVSLDGFGGALDRLGTVSSKTGR